jgi:hypothetical protein
MDPHDFEALRHALISTGFPLEATVEDYLHELLFYGITTDVGYSRRGSDGPERDVDFVARRGVFRESLEAPEVPHSRLSVTGTLHVAIECKSRRTGVKWFFSHYGGEEPARDWGPVLRPRGFVSVSHSVNKLTVEKPVAALGVHGASICSRGIELRPSGVDGKPAVRSAGTVDPTAARTQTHQYKYDSDPSSIRNGVSQLQFAMPSMVHRVLSPVIKQRKTSGVLEVPDLSTPPGARLQFHVDIFAAYLVTTAELWLLKSGTGFSEIGAAKSLDEIATSAQMLELTSSVSDERRNQVRQAFASDTRWSAKKLTDPATRQYFDWLEPIVAGLEVLRPSVFIVTADSLRATLKDHMLKLEGVVKEMGLTAGAQLGLKHWA